MDNEIKALSDTLIGEIAFALGFSETGLVYRAGRRPLEERTIPRELGSATW